MAVFGGSGDVSWPKVEPASEHEARPMNRVESSTGCWQVESSTRLLTYKDNEELNREYDSASPGRETTRERESEREGKERGNRERGRGGLRMRDLTRREGEMSDVHRGHS